jgi:hypothetical protein
MALSGLRVQTDHLPEPTRTDAVVEVKRGPIAAGHVRYRGRIGLSRMTISRSLHALCP